MNKINKSVVSIVMSTFNRADQLEQTLKNIFAQNYSKIELVIVNDGSSDNTTSVLNKLNESYNFKIIENSKNLGLQKSLNIGISQSSGEYIARIDDHDLWIDEDKLTKQVAFLASHPEVGVVGTGYRVGQKDMTNPTSDAAIRRQILLRSPFCHVSVLMRRSIVDKVGGYNESLPYSEDWDLWLKMGNHAQLANLPDIMVATQEEDQSLSGNYFLKQLPINRKLVKSYFNSYPGSFRAYFYHQFIRVFFALVPLNGSIHKWMKQVYLNSFSLLSKNESTS